MQYKIWMDEDYKAAWQSYLKLCRLSASDFYTEMLKEVGLQIPFEDGCVRTVTEKTGSNDGISSGNDECSFPHFQHT